MPKRQVVAPVSHWEGEQLADDVGNEVRQSILTELATGVGYSIEFQDPKIHTSLVWRYFGVLLREGTPLRAEIGSNYCALCLQNGILFKYSKATANGNLLRHLRCAHHLELEARRRREPKSDNSHPKRVVLKAKMPRRSKKQQGDLRDSKFQLAREIALWLARDLRPLSWIPNTGMKQFLRHFGVIGNDFEMPSSSAIHQDALDDVYNWVEERAKQLLADPSIDFHLSVECYSDNYRQVSHLSCTVHWVDANWNVRQINLGTILVELMDNNPEMFSKMIIVKLKEFGIEKIMYIVTDSDTKVVEAAAMMEIDRLPCMAGTISELVIKDLLLQDDKIISEFQPLQDIVTKLRILHRHLALKIADHWSMLEKSWAEAQKDVQLLKSFLESCSRIDSMLEAEERIGDGNDGAVTVNNWIISWYLCDHYLKHKEVIDELPLKEPLIENDYKICSVIKEILGELVSSTEILTGPKYSTLSSTLLFRSEIVDSLEKLSSAAESAGDELKKAVADQLLSGVVSRFVISESTVCAAMVDPAMKDLGIIDQYLTVVMMNKHDFIKSMLVKHKLLHKVDEAKARATIVKQEDESSFQKEDSKDGQKHKKLRLQLLTKHSNTEALSSLDFEIRKYLLVSDASDDPLSWWKANGEAFPYMQRLARLYLAIPATAIPFERAFSTTGMAATAARTSLCTTVTKKMLFIHDNYDAVVDKVDA